MKKFIKIFIILIIIVFITFGIYKLTQNKSKKTTSKYPDLEKYISTIYGKTYLIPEFENINDADENWLWENINQYLHNNSEFDERNSKQYDYTYDEICQFVNTIYGPDLKKTFPTGAEYMRYDTYHDKYGPTSYGLEYYYDYKIENIDKNENIYTISIYDFTVSLYRTLGENPDDLIDIYNNYEFILNEDNGTPITSIKNLNDKNFSNILDYKDKLSHKILTIKYDEKTKNYYITSCRYVNTKPEEILAVYYKKMQNTFEVWNIDYEYDDIYTSSEILVKNFDKLSSIYTENSIETYKNEMDLFVFKDNGEVYITAGDINIADYIDTIDIKNVKNESNKISCDIVRTFRKSFNPEDTEYNETYTKTDNFTIIKDSSSNSWLIDKFNYNN